MKLLFLNPPNPYAKRGWGMIRDVNRSGRASPEHTRWPQTSLAQIAALFPSHEVQLWDCVVDGTDNYSLLDRLKVYRPDWVVVQSVSATFTYDMVSVGYARSLGARTVLISPHANALESEVRERFPAIDEIFHYSKHDEPEYAIRELITGERRQEGESFETLPIARQDLLPIHQYDLPLIGRNYTFVISSRACAWQCAWCRVTQTWKTRPRFRRPVEIVKEIDTYHLKNIVFHADVFTMNKQQVYEICERMPKGVRWCANSRVDTVDLPLLQAMKRSGCWQLFYGVESGNDRVLELNNKKATVAQAEQAIRWTKEAGIRVHAYMMMGQIGETPESMMDNIRFAKRIPADSVNFSVCTPYPDTAMHRLAADNGWLKEHSYEDFDQSYSAIVDQPTCTAEQVKQFQRRAYLEWYCSLRGLKFLAESWKPRHARFFWNVAKAHLSL